MAAERAGRSSGAAAFRPSAAVQRAAARAVSSPLGVGVLALNSMTTSQRQWARSSATHPGGVYQRREGLILSQSGASRSIFLKPVPSRPPLPGGLALQHGSRPWRWGVSPAPALTSSLRGPAEGPVHLGGSLSQGRGWQLSPFSSSEPAR